MQATRERLDDGTVVLRSAKCAFEVRRLRPGVVHVRIAGTDLDDGSLGKLPTDELDAELRRYAPVEVFIDASGTPGAVAAVQNHWADWFARHAEELSGVHMLVRGKYLEVTVGLVKFFSRTSDLIRVYLDPAAFAEALEKSERRRPR